MRMGAKYIVLALLSLLTLPSNALAQGKMARGSRATSPISPPMSSWAAKA
jgi:hypothetical protein